MSSELELSSDDEPAQFGVEKVVDHRWINSKIQYKLHYSGLNDNEDVWEEESENPSYTKQQLRDYITSRLPKSQISETSQNDETFVEDEIPIGLRLKFTAAFKEGDNIFYIAEDTKGVKRKLTSKKARNDYPTELLEYLERKWAGRQ